MSWLKGTSTLGQIPALLTQLAVGETTDGGGSTVAPGDAWVREAGGQDTMRSPASVQVGSGAWAARSGYYSLLGVTATQRPGDNAGPRAGSASVCRVSTPIASVSTAVAGRIVVSLAVTTANTTPGDYSTARVSLTIADADLTTIALINQAGLAPSAAGVVGFPAPYSGGLTLSDPSGTLTVGSWWARGFSMAYPYGIDWWPMWSRRQGGSSPTFTVAPAGVAGTDYDIIDQVTATTGLSGAAATILETGAFFSGLGIKTATGNGGARYAGSFPIALLKARIFGAGSNGLYSLDPGPSVLDTVNGSVMRPSCCTRSTSWLQCIQSPGSAGPTTPVQYWLSVKATGLYVVLNADPGDTGKLGTAYIGVFTAADTTNDVFPVMHGNGVRDFTNDQTSEAASCSTGLSYWRVRRCRDGSEGGRDWQTGFARADFVLAPSQSAYWLSRNTSLQALGYGIISTTPVSYVPQTQAKPNWDGTWWLYGVQFTELGNNYTGNNDPQAANLEQAMIRGAQAARWLALPQPGFGNGDELTDSISGITYFLVMPDYIGLGSGHRFRFGVNAFDGATAVAEL